MKTLLLILVYVLCIGSCTGLHRMKLFKRHTSSLSLDKPIQNLKSAANMGFNLPLKEYANAQYYGSISLGEGSQAQCFQVFFDITSSLTWFPGMDNIVAADSNHKLFNCNKSSTCIPSGNIYNWTYASDSGKAELVHETYCLGCEDGLCVKDQPILVSTQQGDNETQMYPFKDYPYGAVVGLSHESFAINGTQTPFSALLSSSSCQEKVIGFWTNPDQSSQDSGEMTICGTDPKHYNSSLVWTPITDEKQWQFAADSISVGSKAIRTKFSAFLINQNGILGPKNDILQLFKELNVTAHTDGDWISAYVTCTKIEDVRLPSITITIAGAQFTVTPQDYVVKSPSENQCMLMIGAHVSPQQDTSFYFGITLMKAAYTVLDPINNRIGFSPIAMSAPLPSSSTMSAPLPSVLTTVTSTLVALLTITKLI